MSWQKMVYGKETEEEQYSYNDYLLTAKPIFKRDNFYCQSCEKKFKKERLTVHHIIPRDKGGNNEPSNLITLCHDCHNEIEELNLDAKFIKGYKANIKFSHKPKVISDGEIDWRKFVYGGARRNTNGYC